jgi:hypothetical protein
MQGDICEPIHPPRGSFMYFMVLIDASTRWSHVCLLSTRNVAFARLFAQIIRLRAQFPDYPIKKIRFDYPCSACSQGKLIIKPSPSKIAIESPSFLERCKGIFVNLYTHHVDHSCILWY